MARNKAKLASIVSECLPPKKFWQKYRTKVVAILPVHAEKWAHIKRDPAWGSILCEFDIFVADGVGLSWGYKLLSGKSVARCSGIDLINALIEKYPRTPTYIWGTKPEVIKRAKDTYIKRGLNVVGYHDGYSGNDPDILASIRESKAKIVFVGMGARRAAELVVRIKKELGITAMTAGGSFDVASGDRRRAPFFFQRLGFEWLWRMLIEPRRFKRLPKLFLFVWYVMLEKTGISL